MHTIAITPPYFYPGEADAIVRALTLRGFQRVHIRKPGASADEMSRLLDAVPPNLRQRLSLHDCHHLAVEYGIGGLHLNSRNPFPPFDWKGITSRSIHSIDEIASLTNEDYAFISPVFPSISKPGYNPAVTPDALSPYLDKRIFALGGVTPSSLPLLQKAGFGGAAMLGAAWKADVDTTHFRLQFITHPTQRLSVVDGALLALKGGCRWIQLRHKDADEATLRAEAIEIATLCHEFNATFIIDDYPHLVHETGAHGVHLGKNDMPVALAREIVGPEKIIGATANTFDDVAAAAAAGADYVGLGPFRFTHTKKNLSPVLGTGGYSDIIRRCAAATPPVTLPVVAIGGITPADIPSLMATGVTGVALSSTILSAPDPVRHTALTIETINNSING